MDYEKHILKSQMLLDLLRCKSGKGGEVERPGMIYEATKVPPIRLTYIVITSSELWKWGGGKCLKRGHKSWGCVRPRVIPNKVTRDSDKVLHNEVRPNSKCLSKSGGQRLAGFISPY